MANKAKKVATNTRAETIPMVIRQGDMAKGLSVLTGASRRESEAAIGYMLGFIRGAVQSGRKVVLMDFGTFEPVERPARKARNPGTGEPIDVPARRAVRFRAAKAFRENVAGTASDQPAPLLGSPEAAQAKEIKS